MYNRGSIMNEDERIQLYNWAISMKQKMRILHNCRRDYKLLESDPEVLPLVFEIRKRLEEKEDLASFEKEVSINDFLGFVSPGGYIYKHTDPNNFEKQCAHIRFNVYISVPKIGCKTYYDGHLVDTQEGCYALCRSGIDEHWTDPNEDTIPRISLSFGYLLPAEKIDDLCKDPKIGIYTQLYPLVNFK